MNHLPEGSFKKTNKFVHNLLAQLYYRQGTPEWERQRLLVPITGTRAAAFDDYIQTRTNADDIFDTINGLKCPWAGNAMTDRGTYEEPNARAMYEARTGLRVFVVGLVVSTADPQLGASIDGVREDGVLIEIKTAVTRTLENDHVPPYHWPQVQHTLHVLDAPSMDFIQFDPTHKVLQVKTVHRDPSWFDRVTANYDLFKTRVAEHRRKDSGWLARALAWNTYAQRERATPGGPMPPVVRAFLQKGRTQFLQDLETPDS
jgi:hypothetical protein